MIKSKHPNYYDTYFGRPRAFYNAQEMIDKAIEYFRKWEDECRPFTIAGLCLYLKVDQRTFNNYVNGRYDHIDDFSSAAKIMKSCIIANMMEKALLGHYHPGFTQYNLLRM